MDQLHQFARFRHCSCQRFFNKYVFAFPDGFLTKMKMKMGRSDDVDDITGIYQGIGVRKTLDLVFLADFGGVRIIGVIESYQLRFLDLLPIVQMKLPQMPNSENPYFKHL